MKVALINAAEFHVPLYPYPPCKPQSHKDLSLGIMKITHELSDPNAVGNWQNSADIRYSKIELLDEVFGAKSIKPLHSLLPKV